MKNKSLTLLREIIGSDGKPMTQKKFAAMVGVCLSSIKNAEYGGNTVGRPLANKIALATGAQLLWWDFRHPKNGKVKRIPVPNGKIYWLPIGEAIAGDAIGGKNLGRDYTPKHFEYHRQFFKTDVKAADLALKEITPVLRALFEKAAKSGLAGLNHRLPALRASLWDWISDANHKLKLGVKLPGAEG